MSAKRKPDSNWEPLQWSSWIRDKLRRREMSAADFARAMNRSSGTVSRWITGERRPSPESCELIADVLHDDRRNVMAIAGYPVQDRERDPRTEAIVGIVERIKWNDERELYARALLESMLKARTR